MEKRQRLRRVADLGIENHQPGIAAYVEVDKQEDECIAKCLMSQKVGANNKSNKAYEEHWQRIKESDVNEKQPTIKVKKAKLAVRNIAKWKRIRKKEEEEEEEQVHNEKKSEQPSYSSRILTCMRCTTKIETKEKQLHTKEGFRGIYCPSCKKQDRCLFNLCQCGQIWHQCSIHGVDPGTHNTTKGTRRKSTTEAKQPKKEEGKKSSSRRAPVTNVKEIGGKGGTKSKRGTKKRQQPTVLHTKFVASKNPPRSELVERIRRKQKEKQKNELEEQSLSRTTFQISRNEGTPSHGGNQVQRNETQGREVYDRKAFIDDLKAQANKQKQTSQHRALALHDNLTINRIQKAKK